MAHALTSWVWVLATLARINDAESRGGDLGRSAGQKESARGDLTDAILSAPVWSFLPGNGKSPKTGDYSQPQYRCSNRKLSLRFSLIRYGRLRLEDGTNLSSLPDSCNASVHLDKWWLLVTLPYKGCQTSVQAGRGIKLRPLKLLYFDRLLQQNMTAMPVCKNPAESPRIASPLVSCRTHITVKLPAGANLRRVRELEFFTNEGFTVKQQNTLSALYVEISSLAGRDSSYELVYVDSTGNLRMILAACSQKLPKKSLQHRVKRQLDVINIPILDDDDIISEMWDFEEAPPEGAPFDPDAALAVGSAAAGTGTSETDEETDDGNFEMWDFEEVPEGVFTGDSETVEAAVTTTTTIATPATTITTTTAAPATTATTTTTPAPVLTTTETAPTTTTTLPLTTTTTVAPATTVPSVTTPTPSTQTITTASGATVTPATALATTASPATTTPSTTSPDTSTQAP